MAKNLIKCGITPKRTMLIIEYYQVELIFCFIFILFLLQSYARHHSVLGWNECSTVWSKFPYQKFDFYVSQCLKIFLEACWNGKKTLLLLFYCFFHLTATCSQPRSEDRESSPKNLWKVSYQEVVKCLQVMTHRNISIVRFVMFSFTYLVNYW